MNSIIAWTQNLLGTNRHFFRTTTTTLASKNLHIETLRGVAIILVVVGHIIGSDSAGGMRVADDSIFRYLYFSLIYIRMPLFTIISGWVYANKPVSSENKTNFLSGKIRRLLIPMFVVSTLLYLMRIVVPGTNTQPAFEDIWLNLIFPYDVYWYLYSLFLIFLFILVLDTQPIFKTLRGWLTVLILSFVALTAYKLFVVDWPNVFSHVGALYLFPFFVLGIGLKRFSHLFTHKRMTLLFSAVFAIGILIQQLSWFGYIPQQEKHSILGVVVGISGVLLLFHLQFRNSVLEWIGNYAYSIFLFHVFFTGGTRIILHKLGIYDPWLILIAGTFASVIIPILIDALARRTSVTSLFLLGVRTRK